VGNALGSASSYTENIADNECLPFKQTLLSDEDAEFVDIVKERLRNPEPVRVTLDDL
jgi:RHH-type rel operon transcriptional repressor/antitoxin RelB